MKLSNFSIFSAAFLGAMAFASLGRADPGPGSMGPGPDGAEPGMEMGMHRGMMKAMLKKEVGLSDAQIAKIQKLKYDADRARIDLKYKIDKERLELQRLMDAGRPDKAKVMAEIEKLGALNTKIKKNRVGLMLDIRALMTQQQWEKMERMHQEHRKMRKRMRRTRRMEPGSMGMDPEPPPGP